MPILRRFSTKPPPGYRWMVDEDEDSDWYAIEALGLLSNPNDRAKALQAWEEHLERQLRLLVAGQPNQWPTNWKKSLRRAMEIYEARMREGGQR